MVIMDKGGKRGLKVGLAAAVGLIALSAEVAGFFPGAGHHLLPNLAVDVVAPGTHSHADQTSGAITTFLHNHFGPDPRFGFPPELFRKRIPAGVKSARQTIVAANEGVDQDFSYSSKYGASWISLREKDYGPAHFDNEYLAEGQNHLLKLRSEMISLLHNIRPTNPGDVDKARIWLGRQLHTLQDFYAHSNWIEMTNSGWDISPVIGNPSASMYPKPLPNEPTCSEYCLDPSNHTQYVWDLYMDMNKCYRDCFQGDSTTSQVAGGRLCAVSCDDPQAFCKYNNACKWACGNNTIELSKITTGYYYTQGDPNSRKPSGKCSHGGLSDRGATGIEGINKDSSMAVFSPHHYLHSRAAIVAERHSLHYISQLTVDFPSVDIDGVTYPQPALTERHLRLLFGLNAGSLAFVIDRSTSMATALPQIKGAIRAVVSRLQNMGYVPVHWTLIGYGPSYNTQITTTEDVTVFLDALDALAVDDSRGCMSERFWEALAYAARDMLDSSKVFFFTDEPAEVPEWYDAQNNLYWNEFVELVTIKSGELYVIEHPTQPGFPYLEHPFCGLKADATRSRDMRGFGVSMPRSAGKAVKLRPDGHMLLRIANIVTDGIFSTLDTFTGFRLPAGEPYKAKVSTSSGAEGAATREIVVDSTTDFLEISTAERNQDNIVEGPGDVTIRRPDGTVVKPLEDSDVVQILFEHERRDPHKIFIPDPQPGTWTVTRNYRNTEITLQVSTPMSFTFNFVRWQGNSPHKSWISKPDSPDLDFSPRGWPSAGWALLTVRAQVEGPIQSIDAFHLRSAETDAVIMPVEMTRVNPDPSFMDEGLGNLDPELEEMLQGGEDHEHIYMAFLKSSDFLLCGPFYATVTGVLLNGESFTLAHPYVFEDKSRDQKNWGRPRDPSCPASAVPPARDRPPVLEWISSYTTTSTTSTSTSTSSSSSSLLSVSSTTVDSATTPTTTSTSTASSSSLASSIKSSSWSWSSSSSIVSLSASSTESSAFVITSTDASSAVGITTVESEIPSLSSSVIASITSLSSSAGAELSSLSLSSSLSSWSVSGSLSSDTTSSPISSPTRDLTTSISTSPSSGVPSSTAINSEPSSSSTGAEASSSFPSPTSFVSSSGSDSSASMTSITSDSAGSSSSTLAGSSSTQSSVSSDTSDIQSSQPPSSSTITASPTSTDVSSQVSSSHPNSSPPSSSSLSASELSSSLSTSQGSSPPSSASSSVLPSAPSSSQTNIDSSSSADSSSSTSPVFSSFLSSSTASDSGSPSNSGSASSTPVDSVTSTSPSTSVTNSAQSSVTDSNISSSTSLSNGSSESQSSSTQASQESTSSQIQSSGSTSGSPSSTSASQSASVSVTVVITTYTSGSITTTATALPVSSSDPTWTSSSAQPSTTKKCSCRAKRKKGRLNVKRDGTAAALPATSRNSVHHKRGRNLNSNLARQAGCGEELYA